MLKSCPWTLLVLLAALLVGCAKSTKTTADGTEADPDTTVAMGDGQDEAVEVAAEEVAAEEVAADVVATEDSRRGCGRRNRGGSRDPRDGGRRVT